MLQAWGLQLYEKRDPGTGVSCEFTKILKNILFTDNIQATASENQGIFSWSHARMPVLCCIPK